MQDIVAKCFREKRFDEIKQLLKGNTDLESRILLAKTYHHLAEYDEVYQLLKDGEYNDESLFFLMIVCNILGKFEETIQVFDKVQNKVVDYYFMTIEAKIALGQLTDALVVLKEAETLNEKRHVVCYYYYFIYIKMEKYDLASQFALEAYQLEKNAFNYRNWLQASFLNNDVDSIVNFYQEYDDEEVNWLYFISLTEAKQHQKAVEFGLKLIEKYPSLTRTYNVLAHNHLQLENYEKVIEYAKVHENDEDIAIRNHSLEMMREAYEKLGDLENAKRYSALLPEALEMHFDQYMEAERLFGEGNYDEMITVLDGIDTLVADRQRCFAYYQLGDYHHTLIYGYKVLQQHADVEVQKLVALANLNLDQTAEAITILAQLEVKEEQLEFVYANMSVAYAMQENLDEAIHYAFLLCELDKENFEAAARLAHLYILQHDTEKAVETLYRCEKIATNDDQLMWVTRNLGINFYSLGEFDKAYTHFKKYPILDEQLWVPYHMGLICAALDKFMEAAECFEFLAQQENVEDEIYYRLALCYIETNQNKKFQDVYDICEQLSTKSEQNKTSFEIINDIAFRGNR